VWILFIFRENILWLDISCEAKVCMTFLTTLKWKIRLEILPLVTNVIATIIQTFRKWKTFVQSVHIFCTAAKIAITTLKMDDAGNAFGTAVCRTIYRI